MQAGKFPSLVTHSDDLNAKVLDLKSTIKFQMKIVNNPSIRSLFLSDLYYVLVYLIIVAILAIDCIKTGFYNVCLRCSACLWLSATWVWLRTNLSRMSILP